MNKAREIYYEDKLMKMKTLERKLRKCNEMVCVEHDKLEIKSACVEVCYEELFERLKNELCSAMHVNQEEECLEVENTRKKIDDEFELDVREECFEEIYKDEESEKYMESYDDVESEDVVESEEEKEHEESEEKEEYENGHLLCRMFDG